MALKLWRNLTLFIGSASSTFNLEDGRILCTWRKWNDFESIKKKINKKRTQLFAQKSFSMFVYVPQHISVVFYKIHSILLAECIHPCGVFGIFHESHVEHLFLKIHRKKKGKFLHSFSSFSITLWYWLKRSLRRLNKKI